MASLLASDLPAWVVLGVAFVFGAVWGSFFNVAIYRWPREMSVVAPASHCPSCGAPVRAYHNVPIFGYLFLRGRAACCGAKLSPRYLAVELLSAALCVALAQRYVVAAPDGAMLGDSALLALVYFAFAGALIVATFVDLEWMEIPDEVSLPTAALGLVTAGMRPEPGAESAALGAGAGFLAVQLVFVWAYERLTGRRGMGEGDAKLLLAIGAFVGWQGALFAIVAGSMQGLVVAAIALATGRGLPTPPSDAAGDRRDAKDTPTEDGDDAAPEHSGHLKIPFGPFLALGALEFLFFGDRIVEWYLGLF